MRYRRHMRKIFAGARLRRIREAHDLSQSALARRLGLSPSYLNQLEHDQRPLTVSVLLLLQEEFGLDAQFFAVDTDARLAADLRDMLVANAPGTAPSASEIEELVRRMPDIAHLLVDLNRRLVESQEQIEQLSSAHHRTPVESATATAEMPYERVRDFFYDRHNHIAALDEAAETFVATHLDGPGSLDRRLAAALSELHGVRVAVTAGTEGSSSVRVFDPRTRVLTLARHLTAGQRAFQMATQLAFLEHAPLLDALVDDEPGLDAQSRHLTRIGLANYYSGALVLPYREFLAAAEELRYDIDLLVRRFDVGFETICHRLSTLQRPGARGVPFFFVRTDRAGNISKRQSASSFHFSRVGGGCPLWVVHDTFSQPGRVLTQVSQMPDGRTYLWIARTTDPRPHAFGTPDRQFAIGLGCDIHFADRLVYSRGLALDDPGTATRIGAGCKVCPRTDCAQRAFPPTGTPILPDENRHSALPYPVLRET